MHPNIQKVNAAIKLIKNGEGEHIEPFMLHNSELCLMLQSEHDAVRRLALARRFASFLLDTRCDDAVAFINFATEK